MVSNKIFFQTNDAKLLKMSYNKLHLDPTKLKSSIEFSGVGWNDNKWVTKWQQKTVTDRKLRNILPNSLRVKKNITREMKNHFKLINIKL